MPDLQPPLTDVARHAERVATPDFDRVLTRARVRRRRQRSLTAVVALAVVAGTVAVATSLPGREETGPPVTHRREPAQTPVATRIRTALAKGTTTTVAAADAGHVLIVRKYCPPGRQRCWWGSEIAGVPRSRRPAAQVGPVPVVAGTTGFWIEPPERFLARDGSLRVHPLGDERVSPSRPTPDAVLGMLDDGSFMVYEPSRDRLWSVQPGGVSSPPIRALLLTDDGTIWMQQDDGSRALVASSGDGGRTWERTALPPLASGRYGDVLWHAGGVGVPVYAGDGSLRSIRVLQRGRWTDVASRGPLASVRQPQPGGPQHLAALSDGRLYVRDDDFRLWQAAPGSWSRWRMVGRGSPLTLSGSRDVLLGVGDDHRTVHRWTGRTWQVVG